MIEPERGGYEAMSYTVQATNKNEEERLNLGCGHNQPKGWHNVDVDPDVDPDEVVDLERTPWPWARDTWDVIRAEHVLEHLSEVPWIELTRVLAHGGTLEITYPIGHTRFEDVTHEHIWNVHSAEMLAGERRHSHEVVDGLRLVEQDVEWELSIDSRLLRYWMRYHLYKNGVGPWLEQVPGCYGEVTAVYHYNP